MEERGVIDRAQEVECWVTRSITVEGKEAAKALRNPELLQIEVQSKAGSQGRANSVRLEACGCRMCG